MASLLDGIWLERAVQAVLARVRTARPTAVPTDGVVAPPTRFVLDPFNLDGALRYAAIIDLLASRFRPDVKILEVGSGSGGITQFLRFPIHGLDPAFDRTETIATPYLIRVAGRAEAMPLPDDEFDVVITAEMLEHIPADGREPALREMLRVLRPGGRLVATFPADATARACDLRLNNAYRARYGEDHPWVIEHIREGVPSTDEMRVLLEGLMPAGGVVAVHKHLHHRAWLFQQLIYSARRWFAITLPLGLHSRLGVSAVFAILRRFNGTPAYRTILVADLPETSPDNAR